MPLARCSLWVAFLLLSTDVVAPQSRRASTIPCSHPRWVLVRQSVRIDGVEAADASAEAPVWNPSGELRWDNYELWLEHVNAAYSALAFTPEDE